MLRPATTFSAGSARSAASAAASSPVMPLAFANATPTSSADGLPPGAAFLRKRVGNSPSRPPPDSMIALWNRPFASGEVRSISTEPPPADSPNTVTLRGSPPNAAMFACTQRIAASWSM